MSPGLRLFSDKRGFSWLVKPWITSSTHRCSLSFCQPWYYPQIMGSLAVISLDLMTAVCRRKGFITVHAVQLRGFPAFGSLHWEAQLNFFRKKTLLQPWMLGECSDVFLSESWKTRNTHSFFLKTCNCTSPLETTLFIETWFLTWITSRKELEKQLWCSVKARPTQTAQICTRDIFNFQMSELINKVLFCKSS